MMAWMRDNYRLQKRCISLRFAEKRQWFDQRIFRRVYKSYQDIVHFYMESSSRFHKRQPKTPTPGRVQKYYERVRAVHPLRCGPASFGEMNDVRRMISEEIAVEEDFEYQKLSSLWKTYQRQLITAEGDK